MRSEQNALEKFREIVNEAHENGEKTLLIWKNPEEREKLGGNFYGHLNGPIVLIPSCRVVEKLVE